MAAFDAEFSCSAGRVRIDYRSHANKQTGAIWADMDIATARDFRDKLTRAIILAELWGDAVSAGEKGGAK